MDNDCHLNRGGEISALAAEWPDIRLTRGGPGGDPDHHASRATPLRLSRSCISVSLGISSCEQLETVVSWQTAEFIERPVCQRRGARLYVLHQLWLLSCEGQTLLV